MVRLHLELSGAVQGVGFRPFVYQLANELGLTGWARNSSGGVEVEIEGASDAVNGFQALLEERLPPHAFIARIDQRPIPRENARTFRIEKSVEGEAGTRVAEILPDLATCDECLAEIMDPSNRRFAYPFTNCTHCGPRFSILLKPPYDRANTTMARFSMCNACREEYESPANRRFHAQPNACPKCGPQLSWLDPSGERDAACGDALERAAVTIERGRIVAVKGLGGFHLFVDARNAGAIEGLLQRKGRSRKPFALMVPSLEHGRSEVEISNEEAEWLLSPAAPIVILPRRADSSLPDILAPGNPGLGIMLPYTPLHTLLMNRIGFPVVATSGNRGNEPICIDNDEAVERLGDIADGFLVHDRPIARAVDDSVVRMAAGRAMPLRRSRGYAPSPIAVEGLSRSALAYGGDLKGAIAVADEDQVYLSQHVGDLESLETRLAFERQLIDFSGLRGVAPRAVACDRHPSYYSRQLAAQSGERLIPIQHHHAHAIACAADNALDPEAEFLGVVWDGTGYGDDGFIWGGEFLRCRGNEFKRFAWLRPFPLPGGGKAIRDPRFAALGCLHEAGIGIRDTPLDAHMSEEEISVGQRMIERRVNTPLCSSAGRLFDAVSALCGLCDRNAFEGEAAMALEFLASGDAGLSGYPFIGEGKGEGEIDWRPLLRAVVQDLVVDRAAPAVVSARFHRSLVEMILEIAGASRCQTIALTGGCFQNVCLLERTIAALEASGVRAIWARQAPSNDGGLALGQAVLASRILSSETE